MSNQCIEKRLLKYLPKESIPFVVWLDHEHHTNNSNTYWLVFGDSSGRELSSSPLDSVSELRFSGSRLWKQFKQGERDQ